MAPENDFNPYLPVPFVNHDLMAQQHFANRLVRVPCILKAVHDVTTATVKTTDGWKLNINLTTAFKKRADGTFSPVTFPDSDKYFVLEEIVKNEGWWLMLMKQPEVIGACDMHFVNEIIEFASDNDWLDMMGRIFQDPRLELEYTGKRKLDLLKLVTNDTNSSEKAMTTAKSMSTVMVKMKPSEQGSITESDTSTPDPGSTTASENAYTSACDSAFNPSLF